MDGKLPQVDCWKAPASVPGWSRLTCRRRLRNIIFEADTAAGKAFDVVLIAAILLSVVTVSMESVQSIYIRYGMILRIVEWTLTVLFTMEYVIRLLCVARPFRYARSFFGLVDLFSIVPTYLSLFVPGSQYLLVVRTLRVLRVFRVLKLAQYLGEAVELRLAFAASRRKITVFLVTILSLVTILGSIMYIIEGDTNGFTSIPRSVYWAIVTLTTVGYGDIAPQTNLGQTLAAFVMLLGYSIFAVPTGIVTAELARARMQGLSSQVCPGCQSSGHDLDAIHCKYCGFVI